MRSSGVCVRHTFSNPYLILIVSSAPWGGVVTWIMSQRILINLQGLSSLYATRTERLTDHENQMLALSGAVLPVKPPNMSIARLAA